MKNSKIPTIFAIIVLLLSIVSITVIIKGAQIFGSGASSGVIPKDIKITNIKDTSFTVTWVTDSETLGFVRYGSGISFQDSFVTNTSKTHFVTIQNLKPTTTYTVYINSGGRLFNDQENGRQIQTSQSLIPSEVAISGKVLDTNNLPVASALVYIAINGIITNSAITSLTGSFIAPIPNLGDTTVLQIQAVSDKGEANALIDFKGAQSIPPLIIGKSFDFRNRATNGSVEVPFIQISLPN